MKLAMRGLVVGLSVFFTGCFNLNLPPEPGPPKPGSISGRTVISLPGRPVVQAVANVQVEVLGTGLITTSDSSGFFRVEGISSTAGQVLFRLDLNGDGRPDRQKLMSLQALQAGPDKQIALGDVVLAENAAVSGKVLRSDVGTPGGHSGTLVFVPVGPYTTTTSDDGSFALNELPEGTLSIAFFRAGYEPQAFDSVTLSSGQSLTLRSVRMEVATSMPSPGVVNGKVRLFDGSFAAGAAVTLANDDSTASTVTGADGAFTFSNVAVGLYSLTARREGSADARLFNVLVNGGTTALPDMVLGAGTTTGAGGGSGSGGGGGFVVGGGSGQGGGIASGGGSGTGGGDGMTGGGTATTGGGDGMTGGGTGTTGGGTGTSGGGSATGGGGPSNVPPATPQNLRASPGNGYVIVSWDPVPDAVSYRLSFSTTAGTAGSSNMQQPNALSPFVHQGRVNGTQYFYAVTALNSFGASQPSAEIAVTPSSASSVLPEVRSHRPDLDDISFPLDGDISVFFNRDMNGATFTPANVSLRLDGGIVPISVSAAASTATINPQAALRPEARYQVNLSAQLTDGQGRPLPPYSWWFTTAPATPTVFEGLPGDDAVTLTWLPVTGALYYLVNRAANATANPTSTFLTVGPSAVLTAANGTTEWFSVAAVTAKGVSAPTPRLSVNPSPLVLGPPGGQRVQPFGRSALITWNTVPNATGYRVLRATRPRGPYAPVMVNVVENFYLDSSLLPDTDYFFVVQTENAFGQSAFTREVGGRTRGAAPEAPSMVTATSGYGWANVSWSAVPNASAYVIWRSTLPTGTPALVGYVTNGVLSYDFDGMTIGTTYRFFVSAVVAGEVGDMRTANVVPSASQAPFPSRLTDVRPRGTNVDVSRTFPSGSTAVALLRSTTSGGPYTTNLGNVTTDSTVAPNTTYFYVVRAENNGVQSRISNELSVTTVPNAAPAAPTNLTVEASDAKVQLRWTATAGTASYRVGSSTSPTGPFTGGSPVAGNASDSATTNEELRYFAVFASNGVLESLASNVVSATTTNTGNTAGLATPSVTAVSGNGAVRLGWGPIANATQYRIFRRTPAAPWVELVSSQPELSYIDTTVTNGARYWYAVQARNGNGQRLSTWSFEREALPSNRIALPPTNLQVTGLSANILARWNPIPGARQYSVRASLFPGGSREATALSCPTNEPWDTTCTIGGAVNGAQYYVSLSAVTPEGATVETPELTVTPSPDAPTGTTSYFDANSGQIVISGPYEPDVTSYRFFKKLADGVWTQVADEVGPYYVSELTHSVPVRFAMQAISANGPGPFRVSSTLVSEWSTGDRTTLRGTPGNGSVTLSWDPVPGVDGYYVYTAPTAHGPWTFAANTSDEWATRTSITSLTNGATRWYRVDVRKGSPGAVSNVIPLTPTSSILAPPNITYDVGNASVELTWSAISNATGYRVLRRLPGRDWRVLVSVTTPGWQDFTVRNGEATSYAVQTINEVGESALSFPTIQTPGTQYALIPENIVVRPGNDGAFVRWDRVSGATGYTVFVVNSAGSVSQQCFPTSEFDTACTLTQLSNGSTYGIRVAARNAAGYGARSPPQSVMPANAFPAVPTGVTLTNPSSGTVSATWNTVVGATSYRVFRRTANSTATQVGEVSTTSFTDMGLSADSYVYTVEALNAAGPSPWSDPRNIAVP